MLRKLGVSLALSMMLGCVVPVNAWGNLSQSIQHTNGNNCPGYNSGGSMSTFSGGWSQTNSSTKTGKHWSKYSVNGGNRYFMANVVVVGVGDYNGATSMSYSYAKSTSNVRSFVGHYHRVYVE